MVPLDHLTSSLWPSIRCRDFRDLHIFILSLRLKKQTTFMKLCIMLVIPNNPNLYSRLCEYFGFAISMFLDIFWFCISMLCFSTQIVFSTLFDSYVPDYSSFPTVQSPTVEIFCSSLIDLYDHFYSNILFRFWLAITSTH